MSRRTVVLLCVVVAGACALMSLPLLMFMVILGGSNEVNSGCAPSSPDVVLASDASVAGLTRDQLNNAAAIVAMGSQLGIPRQGMVVALAVANQESRFLNYANDGLGWDLAIDQVGISASLELPHQAVGTDHGSLGIFQQQWPWWGTMEELMDPATAARKFYEALLQVPGWEFLSVTRAGQAVQNSAYPDAYADDEPLARRLLEDPELVAADVTTTSVDAGVECVLAGAYPGTVTFPLPTGSGYVDRANWGSTGSAWSRGHTGTDFSVACGTPVLAAHGGTVIVRTDQPWAGRWLVQVSTGTGELTTWYAHMQSIVVEHGEIVTSGQPLGAVGGDSPEDGNSTGCHLHFEVHPRGGSIYEDSVDPTAWLARNVGRDLDRDIIPAGGTGVGGSLSVLTANVPFPLSGRKASRQIRWLLAQEPDVLLLQEVHDRNVPAIAARARGNWGVYEPERGKRGSAIVWNADRLRATQTGVELGFLGAAYDRWMAWAVLEATDVQLAVVALHLPTGASRFPVMRDHFMTMTRNYQQLVREFQSAGYPLVMGADWNHPLDVPQESWSPVQALREVEMTTNWLHGTPCTRSSIHGGRIDGFAYDPGAMVVTEQGCLDRGHSDHFPVWIRIAPR